MKNPLKRHHKPETPVEFIEDEVQELKKEYGRFRRFSDENTLLMSVLVLGIAALVVINTLFWMQWTKSQDETVRRNDVAAVSTHITKTLDKTMNAAAEVQVRDVTMNSKADPAFALPDDQTMLIMNLTVTNKTNQTVHFIPVNQLYVRSNEGDYASLHASMHVTNPIPSTDLAPGGSISGQVSFAVPKAADTLRLYVDTTWDNTTPLVIDVLR